MKTRAKILTGIGLIGFLIIGFLIGILVDYPKPDESQLTGTLGKVQKYRKVQMTARDIELRSDLVKDSARLRSMIQGLVYFSLFTDEISSNIDLTVLAFKSQGMGSQPSDEKLINSLQDYSDFIRNNTRSLNGTIALLTGIYLKDSANQSPDIEKNLRDFSNYVTALNEKNGWLIEALTGLDNFMLTAEKLESHKQQINQLKSLRDQMLIKGIQLGAILSSSEQVSSLVVYAVAAQEKLNYVQGMGQIGSSSLAVINTKNLAVILSQDQLQVYAAKEQGVSSQILNQENIGSGIPVFYNQDGLYFLCAMDPSNLAASELYGMQQLALFGNGSLNVVIDSYSLLDVVQSQLITGQIASSDLLQIFSMDNLQFILLSADVLPDMIHATQSMVLGVSPHS